MKEKVKIGGDEIWCPDEKRQVVIYNIWRVCDSWHPRAISPASTCSLERGARATSVQVCKWNAKITKKTSCPPSI